MHIFLTSALAGGELSASRSCRFTTGERASGTHWVGGWVGPRAGLDNADKRKFLTLPGLELRPLGRPARSQSLYRLRYPGSTSAVRYMRCSNFGTENKTHEWNASCSTGQVSTRRWSNMGLKSYEWAGTHVASRWQFIDFIGVKLKRNYNVYILLGFQFP
jgi:hypothetical protein